MSCDYFIGLDVGGSAIKGAVVSPDGKILNRIQRNTESKSSNEVIIGNIYRAAKELMEQQGKGPIAMGIGIPGAVQFAKGVVSRSPHFPGWIDYDLRSALAEKISVPLFMDNDANCAALGEFWLGAGRGCASFCLLTLGTGIGGGIVLESQIYRGMDGMAGEMGHMVVEPHGLACGCGGKGCLEKYVSAHAAVEQALEGYDAEEARKLRQATGGVREKLTAKLLFDLAREGDPYCLELFRRMGRYLGIGLVNLVHIFNMERIIIGGGMVASWDFLIPPAINEMKSRSYKVPAERLQVVRAECAEDAGVLGAVYLAKTGIRVQAQSAL